MNAKHQSVLNLVDVSLSYPDGDAGTVTALDHVHLSVEAGAITSLVGPSGSGKSSLLAVAGSLVRPSSGSVLLDGADLALCSDKERTALRREKIGIIFQQPNLLPSLTALEQLILAEHLRGISPAAAAPRARAMLETVGLSEAAGRRPHQLSGGQRQRVNIARALISTPAVLLVDEPTAALDRDRSDSIVRLLCRLTRQFQVATVLVTHDTEFVALTDSVVSMRNGRLSDTAQVTPGLADARRDPGKDGAVAAARAVPMP